MWCFIFKIEFSVKGFGSFTKVVLVDTWVFRGIGQKTQQKNEHFAWFEFQEYVIVKLTKHLYNNLSQQTQILWFSGSMHCVDEQHVKNDVSEPKI